MPSGFFRTDLAPLSLGMYENNRQTLSRTDLTRLISNQYVIELICVEIFQATPEDGLQSGPLSKTTRKPARRRVVEFLFNEKKDKYEDVDEEEYEGKEICTV